MIRFFNYLFLYEQIIKKLQLNQDSCVNNYCFFILVVIPVIKEKPKVVKIIKKKTVVVECHVLSKFAPDCTWFKETQAVKEDSRHKLHVEQVKDVSSTLCETNY